MEDEVEKQQILERKEDRKDRKKREKAQYNKKKYPHTQNWIVFVNPKSGGQKGASMLESFQDILPDDQIFNLFEGGPLVGVFKVLKIINVSLQRWQQNPEYGIIVCGGDGSVGWVLGVAHGMGLTDQANVGIVPLGTGNDLARVFGWGGGFSGEPSSYIISLMDKAKPIQLDRWKVLCTPTCIYDEEKHNIPVPAIEAEEVEEVDHDVDSGDKAEINDKKSKSKTKKEKEKHEEQLHEELPEPQAFVLNNYFSIGTDAEIALTFHEMREKHNSLFQNQLINKGWYGGLGIKSVATRHGPLKRYIKVLLDGTKLKIPASIRGIVMINIPSYAGGTNPWGTKISEQYVKPAIGDGLFEVFGVRGASHLASIQSKMAHGIRLGQGKHMQITTKRALPAQVDGEPWLLIPSIVTIEYQSKANLLFNTTQKQAAKKENDLLGGDSDSKKKKYESDIISSDSDESSGSSSSSSNNTKDVDA